MFSAMSLDHEFWKERLNVFIALAPVTKLHYTGSALFKFLSEFQTSVHSLTNALHIYSIFGGFATTGTKVICSISAHLCKLVEGFIITKNPRLDDTKRF